MFLSFLVEGNYKKTQSFTSEPLQIYLRSMLSAPYLSDDLDYRMYSFKTLLRLG